MASHPIYQFYAELDNYSPKIWRRFQTLENITPARLCYILQTLFEMKASHLMALEMPLEGLNTILRFEIMNEYFEEFTSPDRNIKFFDATAITLRRIGLKSGDKLDFIYDYGDNWRVSLTLEEVFEDKDLPGKELPRVLEGEGFGILENAGGVVALKDLAKAFKKKKGPDYRHYSEWLGIKDLDLTAFDLEDMNFRLKKLPRIFKQCYEDDIMPTQRSMDLIDRAYLREK